MATSLHDKRFPNESPDYRAARDELLQAEMELRRQLEAVAARRRQLPLGGEVPEDYVFDEGPADVAADAPVRQVRLSELFGPHDSLILYSYMFGPAMKQPCPSCTSILDGLNGQSPHVNQRASFAAVARSPIERVRGVARERGWRHLRLLSDAGNAYHDDYHGENEKGDQLPVLNVFTRRDGKIYHTYATELLFAPSEPGQDGRHVDLIWPLWNLLDYTPEGRGATWQPRLSYAPQTVAIGAAPAGVGG